MFFCLYSFSRSSKVRGMLLSFFFCCRSCCFFLTHHSLKAISLSVFFLTSISLFLHLLLLPLLSLLLRHLLLFLALQAYTISLELHKILLFFSHSLKARWPSSFFCCCSFLRSRLFFLKLDGFYLSFSLFFLFFPVPLF